MARDEALPFARGETFYNGNSETGYIAELGAGGINLEGKEFLAEIPAVNQYNSAAVADPSGRQVRVRCCRNRSSINLLPGRIARWATGTTPNAGYPYGTGSDGYYYQVTDPIAGVIDELLPAAGVPPGDLFWLVIKGATNLITPPGGSPSVANSAQVAAVTGTSAVSADAGFAGALNLSGTTLAQFITKVGRAEATLAATVTANSTVFRAVVDIPSVN